MPLDPKQIVADAARAGLISDGYSSEIVGRYSDEEIVELTTPRVRLPAEVGLAPLPKTDRRSRAYRQRPKQPRKWLTKAEAIAKGYSL